MPTDLETAFPTLSPSHLASLTARGHPREVAAGQVLFAAGDTGFCFYVLLEGSIEIVDATGDAPRTVVVVAPGQFTGEINTLAGRAALVSGRVGKAGRVLELSAAEMRRAVDEIPELGEMILKAFIMRRDLLLSSGYTGVRIIGSRFSPAAHRLRDFATRNLIPFTWIDLESDPSADALLRQLGVSPSETPVVLGRNGAFHRNPSLADFAACGGLTATLEGDHVYDLVIVGAGPAGLAASVYAASEGLERAHPRHARRGRPGRYELADRELPRLPHGDLGRRADEERAGPGPALRRADHGAVPGALARARWR